MATFDYNPITGQLDLVGSGASYIDGDVEYHSNLPVTVGTPAVNSAFLVRKGEGLYFISRKPAGIWVRELNNGNLDDWKYAGTFSDLYRDANFRIINDADTSKEIAFSAASIGTGQTRVITVPNKNITLDDAGDSRTPSAHAASHLPSGADELFDQSLNTTDTPTFGGLTCSGSLATGSLEISQQLEIKDGNDHIAAIVAGTDVLTASRNYQLPNASGTIALQGAITASGLTQATARILGRTTASTGAVEELSASDVRSFLNVADGANNYTHPNHTGDVTSVGDGATTIAANSVTYAKMQDISATSRILGRKTASAGDTEECTLSEVLDFVGSAAQGDILYRGASTWTRLAAGTNGHYLQTKGSGANPEWAAVTASGGGATNLWIPASAWIPRTTSGCGVDSREIGSTNRQNVDELLFDAASDEFAQALVEMPNNYNNGTITARFFWTSASGSGAVVWGIQGRAFGDDDALDQAHGTAQTVTDTLLASNDMHVSAATSAVTLGGTPAANTPVQFQIYRDADAAGDTLAVDARLLGVEILFN